LESLVAERFKTPTHQLALADNLRSLGNSLRIKRRFDEGAAMYTTKRKPKGGPRPIGGFVEKALDRAARARGFATTTLLSDWRAIAGAVDNVAALAQTHNTRRTPTELFPSDISVSLFCNLLSMNKKGRFTVPSRNSEEIPASRSGTS